MDQVIYNNNIDLLVKMNQNQFMDIQLLKLMRRCMFLEVQMNMGVEMI